MVLRRTVLRGSMLAVAAAALPFRARADDKQVYLLSWGGTIQTMLEKEGWGEQFRKDTGYSVTLVPKATSSEIIATAIAQKDRPQVDVVLCDHSAWLKGMHQGIFAPIDDAGVPNLAKLYPVALVKGPAGVVGAIAYGDVVAIIYQPDIFKRKNWAPPQGWGDLMRPEFKGMLVIPPVNNTFGMYTLIQLAKMNGGSIDAIDPGFAALKRLAPNVLDWTTTYAKIGEEFQNEEAAVAVFSSGSAVEFRKRGIPASVVIPSPAYLSPTTAGVMAKGPNPDGGRALLNWLLSDKVLTLRATRFAQVPMNRDVKMPTGGEQAVPNPDMATLEVIDYDKAMADLPGWTDRFDREIAQVK
ncbi:MAG TPA: extracellular solute-binding protein [Acetobacteraceae bacterium]|nr:extracellular solute-binding protein [Acetobacteraceae bacterium]